jgi:predicted secreted Zn-dependent protease
LTQQKRNHRGDTVRHFFTFCYGVLSAMFPSGVRRHGVGLLVGVGCLSIVWALLTAMAPGMPAAETWRPTSAKAGPWWLAAADASPWWPATSEAIPVILAERGTGPGGSAAAARPADLRVSAPLESPGEPSMAGIEDRVRVRVLTEIYPVEGADLQTLLASLRQRGPSDGGDTWAASTAWVFRWSYRSAVAPACRVVTARVELDLTYTYPRWTAPLAVPAAAVTAWEAYLAHVELHEHGHREIAEAAAADLITALEALPAERTCDALAVSARALASTVLDRHVEAQATYDRETGHGAIQGAVLAVE